MLLLLLFYLFKYNIYAYNETQYKMSACSAKFRSLGADDEVRNTIKVLECEIAEVDVGSRKLVAEDATNGHPILHAALPPQYLCPLGRTLYVALRSLAGRPVSRLQLDRLKSARALH